MKTYRFGAWLGLVWVLFGFSSETAEADGFPLKNGRYEGEVIVLTLSASQLNSLASESRDIQLTTRQRSLIRRAMGFSPSSLFVYRAGENDDACSAMNVGFAFGRGKVDVPRKYLVSDKEAARIRKEMEEESEE